MKQSLFFNKKFAYFITAIIIALSFLLGGAKSLNSARDKVVTVFEDGKKQGFLSSCVNTVSDFFNEENKAANSLLEDVRKCAEASQTIAVIAEKYLGENDVVVGKLENVIRNMKSTKSIDKIHEFTIEIELLTSELRQKDGVKSMEENDKYDWNNAFNEMASYKNTKNLREYNEKAKSYNKRLQEFPANIIRATRLVEELPIF